MYVLIWRFVILKGIITYNISGIFLLEGVYIDEKVFELIDKMYLELQNGFKYVRSEMTEGFKEIRERIDNVEQTVVRIEKDHGKTLTLLLDGC